MSKLISLRTVAFLGLFMTLARPGLAWADEAWEGRFRREAPVAWAELDRADRRIDDRTPITIEGTLVENMNSQEPQHIRYARSRDRVLLEKTYGSYERPKAFCMVGKEGFALEAQPGQADYSVRFVGRDARDAVSSRITAKMPATVLRFLMTQGRSITPGDHPKGRYEEIFNDPNTHIVAVEPIKRDAVMLVRVRFTYANKEGDELQEMLLDPDHRWLTLESIVQRPSKINTRMTFEYGDDEDGHPTLRRYDMKHGFIDGNGNIGEGWQKWEFTRFSFEPIPDATFTMAAFKLPSFDIAVASTTATARSYWLLLLALAFAAVAVVTRVWRSRRPPTPTGPPRQTFA